MITIILIVLSLIFFAIRTYNAYENEDEKAFYKNIAGAVIAIVIAFIQPFAVEKVDAGYKGIKVKLTGDSRGVSDYEYKTGWVVYNAWTEQMLEFPTYQQHIEYDSTVVITKGGFSTIIQPTFNYSLISSNIGDMFQNLRKPINEIEQGWLKTAIIGAVNDVANKWKVDDIFNKREEFEMAISAECNKRISKWFIVSQLRTNIIPPPSLQAAIESETKAIKEAQAKEQQALVAIANGKKLIAQAQADSAAAVITAAGKARSLLIKAEAEAKAIQIKQKEVTAVYNDYIRASNWDGKLPSTIVGPGSGTLFSIK